MYTNWYIKNPIGNIVMAAPINVTMNKNTWVYAIKSKSSIILTLTKSIINNIS